MPDPDEIARNHALQEWAGTVPFTEHEIPRRSPPACPFCGNQIGHCEHTGGPLTREDAR